MIIVAMALTAVGCILTFALWLVLEILSAIFGKNS